MRSNARKPRNAPGSVRETYRDPKSKRLYPLIRVGADGAFLETCPFCRERHQHSAPASSAPENRASHCIKGHDRYVLARTHSAVWTNPRTGEVVEFPRRDFFDDGYFIALGVKP